MWVCIRSNKSFFRLSTQAFLVEKDETHMLFSRKCVAIRSHFFGPRKWVFIRSHNFFRCGKWVAIRSNNFQIFPKVGGYKVSGRFCVRPYNHPPPCIVNSKKCSFSFSNRLEKKIWKKIGYVTFNENSSGKQRELKTINLNDFNVKGQYLKLEVHECYNNKRNLFNKVK